MLRGVKRVLAVIALCAATEVQAWDAFFRISSETTLRGSSETSSASTRAENAERRYQNDQRECHYDEQCPGRCEYGRCVAGAPPPTAQPSAPPSPYLRCTDDSSCAIGYSCRDGACVQPPPAPNACVHDGQCQQGQSCVNGHCFFPPPPPPPPSVMWRRGSELYLRDRAVQLRQDLALGEGPVISTLAAVRGVPAAALGKAMRAHRAELISLMGDGSDERWMSRVLLKVEALCEAPARVSAR